MDLFNEKQDELGSHNSSTYRHKPTNSRYGPYLYCKREQQNNVNQHEYTGKSNYCNNSERDSNLRNYGYALSRSNNTYENDRQDNNYGAQTIQGKENSSCSRNATINVNQYTGKSNYSNNSERDYTSSRNYGYALSRSNIPYEKDRQDNNYGAQTIQGQENSNCSRNATITSQNYNFATNNPVEPSNVQHENETHSRWENSVNIPNSNISNSNTCTTQSYSSSFNQQMCPSVQNSLDWKSILRINESVGMQVNKGNIESAPPYSGVQANSGLFQSYPFSFNQQVYPSVPNRLDWQSRVRMNKNTNVGMQGNKGNIKSVPSYSGSSQLSSCNEPDDDCAEGSVSDLRSMLSSDKDTDEEMEQNRQNINPPSDPNCIALRPDQALKLLTPDGTEFLKIPGEATNLKIAVNKYFNDSYTCTMEGPEEFKRKAKKAIERFCYPFQAADNWIFKLNNVNCDVTSVRQTLTKLIDQRTNWKMLAENLYKNLEHAGCQMQVRIVHLLENNFTSPEKYDDCRKTLEKLIKRVQFLCKIVNAIILVILKVADAPVHIQVLKQWVEDGKETGNNSIENAFNYIFRNETHLDIDYKQVMQRLPQGVNANVSLIEKVDHLMTSGVGICEKFQWEDRLKLLKRLYEDIIINNYADKNINILKMNVINLQLRSAEYSGLSVVDCLDKII